MVNPAQFREFVIRPVLDGLGLGSVAAEQLLLGTALVESGLRSLRQIGGGPALGVYQMEPATHDDIWWNYLDARPALARAVRAWAPIGGSRELVWNLAYATAMCRVHYLRVRDPLPVAGDFEAMARYWKDFYNTARGKGRPEEFVARVEANRDAF